MFESLSSTGAPIAKGRSRRGFLPPIILGLAAVQFTAAVIPSVLSLVGTFFQDTEIRLLAFLLDWLDHSLLRSIMVLTQAAAYGLTIACTLIIADALKRHTLVPKIQRILYAGITLASATLLFFAALVTLLPSSSLEWILVANNVSRTCFFFGIAFGIVVAVFMAKAKMPGALKKFMIAVVAGVSIITRLLINLVGLGAIGISMNAYTIVLVIVSLLFAAIEFCIRISLLSDLVRWQVPETACDCGCADCNGAPNAL